MEDLVCNICLSEIIAGKQIGEISCNHLFCYECIAKWATIENSCPCCKGRFDVIRRKHVSSTPGRLVNLPPTATIPGKVVAEEQCQQVNQRPVFEDPNFEEWIENMVCLVCGSGERDNELLLCDDCDAPCHTYCVNLDSIPEGDWFCNACTARRASANQRQQRRAQQQAEQRSRRRRRRTVIISDDDDDEIEVVAVRPGRSNNTTRNGVGDLEGFVVSDSEEEPSSMDEEDVALGERLRRRNGGGTAAAAGTRRSRRGGGGGNNLNRLQRERHQRAMQAALDSDFEEELDWAELSEDDEEEDLDLDSPADALEPTTTTAAGGRGGGWRRVNRNTNTTTATVNNRRTTAATRHQPRRQRQQIEDEDDGFAHAGTSARHAVEVLTNNWDSIRRGTANFNQLLANNNNNRRSRQGRESARARVAAVAKEAEDVIDLSDSPAAAAPPPATNTTRLGNLSPPLGITSLSSRLRAELNACREKGAKLPPRNTNTIGRGGAAGASNRNNINNNTPEDAYFAAAAVAATLHYPTTTTTNNNTTTTTKRAGPSSSSTPRSPGSALWRRTNMLGSSPGSGGAHRIRTVHDVQRGAEIARRTPNNSTDVVGGGIGGGSIGGIGWNNSGGGGGRGNTDAHQMRPPHPAQNLARPLRANASPMPLQQRLAARAAAEWGNSTGASGSGGNIHGQAPPWRQVKRSPQQQRQFRPRTVNDPPPHPQPPLRTSPRKQQQRQQQQAEDLSIPMFLRNKPTTTPDQLQSPSYSPPPPSVPRKNSSNNNNANTNINNAGANGGVPNPKQQAYDAVRSHVKMYLDDEAITRAQYKAIARRATRILYQRHGGAVPDDAPGSQEVALVVDEAMISVIRGEI